MEKRQRMTLLGIAAAIAVAAVLVALVAGGGDDDADSTTTPTQATQSEPAGSDTTEPAKPEPPPEPEVTRIRVEGGEPVGGVEEIDVKKNDTLRLVVSSDAPDHVHLHGYDVMRDVGPGKPARLEVKAKIEGIFEVELEESQVPIAELKVEP